MGAIPVSMPQKTSIGFTPSTDPRQAVLLRTELRGLARMSEALDASLVLQLAHEFFAFAADTVAAYRGEPVTSLHEMLLSDFTLCIAVQAAQHAVCSAQR